MTERKPLPAELTEGPFTNAQAAAHGVPRSRLRASDLHTPHRGVRTHALDGADLLQRCLSYAPLLHHGQFFSHLSAAAMHDIPVPAWAHHRPLDVTALHPARAPRGAGVNGHQLDGTHWEVVERHGHPVASAVDAWCQLGSRLTEDDLVIAGDGILRRKQPLATRKQLVRGLARMNGRRGAKRLRLAYERIREGTDSPMETRLRILIVGAGLPEPFVNQPIHDAAGTFLALGDLVYPNERVLVEYDGAVHFATESKAFQDIDRLDRVMSSGWRVIRVNRSHLSDPAEILSTIRQALRTVTSGYYERVRTSQK